MKTFKGFVIEDNNEVFFNTDEFGFIHNIADKACIIVFTNQNKDKADSKFVDDYINKESFSFLIRKEDIGFKPIVDNIIKFDKQQYLVTNVIENIDTFEIFLIANTR